MTRQNLLRYASLATTFVLALGLAATPVAVGQADLPADVFQPNVYTMAIIGDQACANMESAVVASPLGHNLLHVQAPYLMLVLVDGVQTIYEYDEFIWTWQNGETECLHPGLWVVWDADAQGIGAYTA